MTDVVHGPWCHLDDPDGRPVFKSLMIRLGTICQNVTCSKSLPVFCFEPDLADSEFFSILSACRLSDNLILRARAYKRLRDTSTWLKIAIKRSLYSVSRRNQV